MQKERIRCKMINKSEEKACFEVRKIKIPTTISITGQNTETFHQSYDPDMLFTITVPQDVKISNDIGRYLKKHNIVDCNCLHNKPDEAALDRALASALMYKADLGDCTETATVTLVCGKISEKFSTYLKQPEHRIVECGNGIYHIHMTALIDTYVVVMEELSDDERH